MLISRFLKDAQPKDSSSDNRIINVVNFIRKNIDKTLTLILWPDFPAFRKTTSSACSKAK